MAMIIYLFDPVRHRFYPICFFHAVTGLNCPGCGSTRAIHELLHGNVAAAARMNLLMVLSLPGACWWTIRQLAGWMQGQRTDFFIQPVWLWVFLGVASAFTVLRNLPGFEWLSP